MSILPPREKDGEIKFYLAKGLPYRARMIIVFAALAAGVGLQVTAGFWPGFALLVLGSALGMNSGYDSAPAVVSEGKWTNVTPEEYDKVILKAGELKAWDEDFFDGTNTLGIIGFVFMLALLAGAYFFAADALGFPQYYGVYFGLDALAVIVPLWFVGTRGYLKKDRLVIKVEALKGIMAVLQGDNELYAQPMLSLADTRGGGKEPEDARLMIKLAGAPKDFYGVQVQVSLNSVQGKDYPYLYCVLISKAGSGILDCFESEAAPQPEIGLMDRLGIFLGGGRRGGTGKMLYEPGNSGEADIIVARQATTRNSGFYTQPSAAKSVVECSLKLARGLLRADGVAQGFTDRGRKP